MFEMYPSALKARGVRACCLAAGHVPGVEDDLVGVADAVRCAAEIRVHEVDGVLVIADDEVVVREEVSPAVAGDGQTFRDGSQAAAAVLKGRRVHHRGIRVDVHKAVEHLQDVTGQPLFFPTEPWLCETSALIFVVVEGQVASWRNPVQCTGVDGAHREVEPDDEGLLKRG